MHVCMISSLKHYFFFPFLFFPPPPPAFPPSPDAAAELVLPWVNPVPILSLMPFRLLAAEM